MEEEKKKSLKLDCAIDWALMLVIFGCITLTINSLSYNNPVMASIPGMLVLCGITFIGILLANVIPLKIPAMIYISIIALVISLPCFGSIAEFVYKSTSKIHTLGLCTVILAYSGVAIGKNWFEFKKMGWKGIVVTLLVILGTFLGSAVIAQFVLKAQGVI